MADFGLVDGRHGGDVTDSNPRNDSREHELDAFVCGAHQYGSDDQDDGAEEEGAFAAEPFARHSCADGAEDGADVVEGRDGTDHDGGRVAHLREPVFGDHDAGHDTLVVAEEQEAC